MDAGRVTVSNISGSLNEDASNLDYDHHVVPLRIIAFPR